MPNNYHIYQVESSDPLTGLPRFRFLGTTIDSNCDNANEVMKFCWEGFGEAPISCSLITYLPETNSDVIFYGGCVGNPSGCGVFKVKEENGSKKLLVAQSFGDVLSWASVEERTLATVIRLEGTFEQDISDCRKKE